MILKKLDSVELEILRLRAVLLPQKEASAEGRKKKRGFRKRIEHKGLRISSKSYAVDPKLFDIVISGKAGRTSKKFPEHYKRRVIEFLLVVHENLVLTKSYDC
jgi:hypothetical protein